MTYNEQYLANLEAVKHSFIKVCRLRFLNPDGTTAFIIDSNSKNRRSSAFIESGSITVNLQNGIRRTASVTLSNVTGEYDYNVNNLWFGTEIALDEGLVLSDGTPYYFQQGVFVVATPETTVYPSNCTVSLSLVDKWANLDGSNFGTLDKTYQVTAGNSIYGQIRDLLTMPRGNGQLVDNVSPIFTNYYDGMTQDVDGTTVSITNTPYDFEVAASGGSYADVILGLANMLNAWIGYDPSGALRLDPSQDDIDDASKPVQYAFKMDEAVLLGATYKAENTKVYNDVIVVGANLEGSSTIPAARATNFDPRSDTNVNIIGYRTMHEQSNGIKTVKQAEDMAVWYLKKSSILQNSVNISCSQLFHIRENELVTLTRSDKQGSPVERHLVTGFTRPLESSGAMTLTCTSVNDIENIATISDWPPA